MTEFSGRAFVGKPPIQASESVERLGTEHPEDDIVRVAILSDLHLAGSRFELSSLDADVVVLAGDIDDGHRGVEWANDAFSCPVIYVLGNHEYRGSSIDACLRECKAAAASNVHVLERDCVTIHGIRFLGATLWFDCSLFGGDEQAYRQKIAAEQCSDFRLIESSPGHPLSIDGVTEIHLETRDWLERELQDTSCPTVVVTHHAPSLGSVPPHLLDAPLVATYATDLHNLMGAAQLWVHGHIHSSSDYLICGTRVICNPRGNPDHVARAANRSFDPTRVVHMVREPFGFTNSIASY